MEIKTRVVLIKTANLKYLLYEHNNNLIATYVTTKFRRTDILTRRDSQTKVREVLAKTSTLKVSVGLKMKVLHSGSSIPSLASDYTCLVHWSTLPNVRNNIVTCYCFNLSKSTAIIEIDSTRIFRK